MYCHAALSLGEALAIGLTYAVPSIKVVVAGTPVALFAIWHFKTPSM